MIGLQGLLGILLYASRYKPWTTILLIRNAWLLYASLIISCWHYLIYLVKVKVDSHYNFSGGNIRSDLSHCYSFCLPHQNKQVLCLNVIPKNNIILQILQQDILINLEMSLRPLVVSCAFLFIGGKVSWEKYSTYIYERVRTEQRHKWYATRMCANSVGFVLLWRFELDHTELG